MEASLQSDLLDTTIYQTKYKGISWLYQTKTHITHIVYQPLSRVTSPNYFALGVRVRELEFLIVNVLSATIVRFYRIL